MRIAQSQVDLTSLHQAYTLDKTTSTMQAWVGERPASASARTATTFGASAGRAAVARISDEASQAASAAQRSAASRASQARQTRALISAGSAQVASPKTTRPGSASSDPLTDDPKLALLVMLIEHFTGRKVHLVGPGDVPTDAQATAQQAGQQAAAAAQANAAQASAAQAAQAQPAQQGWGVEVHVEQVHQETEATSYQAAGQVVTQDGRAIAFDFSLAMHRDEVETQNLDITAGDAVRKIDPIALKIGAGPVGLSDATMSFDLDADGTAERVALPSAGTYFLAIDRNGNGRIDDGSELLGPTSGDGFGELRALDGDGNGWIDENDAAYARLTLWSGPDAPTSSLGAAGVGALYVADSASTPFEVGGSDRQLGQMVSSSIYLTESGHAGALQQVDLSA